MAGAGAGPSVGPRGRAVALLLVALILAFSAWLRAPGLRQSGFASHDAAGITYNAMLLDEGELPYVASVELKAPGAFYVAWALRPAADLDAGAKVDARLARGSLWVERLQRAANLWAWLALLLLAFTAWRHFGPVAAVAAALVMATHDAWLDSIDANYVTWANGFSVGALALGLEALRSSRDSRWRRAAGAWFGAGLAMGLAAMCKRPVGVGAVALIGAAFVWGAGGQGTKRSVRRLRAMTALAVGLSFSQLPVALHYAAKGQLGAFIDGYLLNRWGADYLSARHPEGVEALREGVAATWHFLGPPLVGALVLGLIHRRREGSMDPRLGLSWVWLAVSLLATAVGFRFYKGYFVPVLPPLALLVGAAVAGAVARLRQSSTGARVVVVVCGLVLAVGLGRGISEGLSVRRDRMHPHDAGGRAISAHINPRLAEGDRVWVWGWHLWDVYTFSGARSGSAIYKSLGLLTPPNDDTWRTPGSPLRFVDGPNAERLLEELEGQPPRWVVLGSSVPAAEFGALQAFLRRKYKRDRSLRLGRVQFWLRRDTPPTPH